MREPTQDLTIKNVKYKTVNALDLRAVVHGFSSRAAMLRSVLDDLAQPYIKELEQSRIEHVDGGQNETH